MFNGPFKITIVNNDDEKVFEGYSNKIKFTQNVEENIFFNDSHTVKSVSVEFDAYPPHYKISKKSANISSKTLHLVSKLPGYHAIVKHPVSENETHLGFIIQSLNDHHKWSREKVADWLDTLDIDLTFKD